MYERDITEAASMTNAHPVDPRYNERHSRTSVLVPFLDKRTFDFTNVAPGATSVNTLDVTLSPALCVLGYYRIRLAVRVHSITVSSINQSISFLVYGTMPTDEDPKVEFLTASRFIQLDLDTTTQAPSLITATGTDPDAYLKILIRASQGVIGTLSATLSASLILSEI